MKISLERRKNLLRIATLAAVIALSALGILLREQLQRFQSLGYGGAFLIALISNASIIFPIPGIWAIFSIGSIFHPLGIALAAGTGGALGELSGYLAGFSGQALIERTDIFKRVMPFVQKYGVVGIAILAAIPNPLFDLAGIAAGMLKIPIWKFFLAAWVGQCIKMLSFAYAGSLSLHWLLGR